VFEGDKYSKFSDEGIPTHDAAGAEIKATPAQLSKFKKGIDV